MRRSWDDGPDEDICPPGCDMSVYEAVIELREKRLDMEDALQEIQKVVEELRRSHTKFLADEKKIDKDQTAADQEIQQFQSEKQRMLNRIGIVITLRLSQIQLCLSYEYTCSVGAELVVLFTGCLCLGSRGAGNKCHSELWGGRQQRVGGEWQQIRGEGGGHEFRCPGQSSHVYTHHIPVHVGS